MENKTAIVNVISNSCGFPTAASLSTVSAVKNTWELHLTVEKNVELLYVCSTYNISESFRE